MKFEYGVKFKGVFYAPGEEVPTKEVLESKQQEVEATVSSMEEQKAEPADGDNTETENTEKTAAKVKRRTTKKAAAE